MPCNMAKKKPQNKKLDKSLVFRNILGDGVLQRFPGMTQMKLVLPQKPHETPRYFPGYLSLGQTLLLQPLFLCLMFNKLK